MRLLVIAQPVEVWDQERQVFSLLEADKYPGVFPVDLVDNWRTGVPQSFFQVQETTLGVDARSLDMRYDTIARVWP